MVKGDGDQKRNSSRTNLQTLDPDNNQMDFGMDNNMGKRSSNRIDEKSDEDD